MKRFILLSLIVCLGLVAYAQSPLKTVSFHKNPNEIVDLRELKEKAGRDSDLDGNKAARIRVKAQGFDEKKMLDFTVFPRPGMEVIYKEFQQGEMWVYVSSKVQGILVIKYMGEFEFKLPYKLEPKCGYDLVLGMETATLVINTVPSAAEIYVDGNKVGTGYGSAAISVGSEHRYKVTCANYVPEEDVVKTDKAEKIERQIELKPNFGYVTIKTEPSGAEIFIDGNAVGRTPYILKKIDLGTHIIELRKVGCELYADKVTIKADDVNKQLENVVLISTSVETASLETSLLSENNMVFTVNGVSFEMVLVEGGTFKMGGTSEQGKDATKYERPIHDVTLSDYYIGRFEVTQELWEAVMGDTHESTFRGKDMPVNRVFGWYDCKVFIDKLNEITGQKFRMPTEAEWEYAARGGNKSKGYKYSGSNDLDDVAWYKNNSRVNDTTYTTHPVGTKLPNELGIYDMSGNVWEHCLDKYAAYEKISLINPLGGNPNDGGDHVLRGGEYRSDSEDCRVSYRDPSCWAYWSGDVGLRLALSPAGDIEIITNPSGAVIINNGCQYGTTPIILNNLIAGIHEFLLIKDGYKDIVQKIEVKKDAKETVSINLSRKVIPDTLNNYKKERRITVNGVSFKMVYVEGGSFMMGATSSQTDDAVSDEKPIHKVSLSDYYIGKFEVTQELWRAVMGESMKEFMEKKGRKYYYGEGDKYPMYFVDWDDCQMFIKKLNYLTGEHFRLPTEAEWEYAARGGIYSEGYKYSGSDVLEDVAWYDKNTSSSVKIVGTKTPNELGVYDMSGNVSEWCSDFYSLYTYDSQINPKGKAEGSEHIIRGGCSNSYRSQCRVSYRGRYGVFSLRFIGMRLVMQK